MSLNRRINDNRPTFTLLLLIGLSLVSLASGAQASFLGIAVRTGASLVAYPFIIAFDRAGSGVSNLTGLVTDHGYLRARVDQLQWELASMQQQIVLREEAARENERLRAMLDFKQRNPRLQLLPAQVMAVEKSGVMRIDRGSVHGLRERMCVMTQEGIVGVVTQVEPFVSSVATLHHQNCHIGVRIQRNRVSGVVHGSGNALTHICELQYIQESDDVQVGDIIITSPGSSFPSGYPVGRVTSIQGGNTLLRTAWIEPAVNIYALDEVFVVMSAQVPIQELGYQRRDLLPVERAHPMPDTRTIQERLAP